MSRPNVSSRNAGIFQRSPEAPHQNNCRYRLSNGSATTGERIGEGRWRCRGFLPLGTLFAPTIATGCGGRLEDPTGNVAGASAGARSEPIGQAGQAGEMGPGGDGLGSAGMAALPPPASGAKPPCPVPLSLAGSDDLYANPLRLFQLPVAGGSGRYRFSSVDNASGGVLNQATGGILPGEDGVMGDDAEAVVVDTYRVEDLICDGSFDVAVNVVPRLDVTPLSVTLPPGQAFSFVVKGGSGSDNLDFSLYQRPAGRLKTGCTPQATMLEVTLLLLPTGGRARLSRLTSAWMTSFALRTKRPGCFYL